MQIATRGKGSSYTGIFGKPVGYRGTGYGLQTIPPLVRVVVRQPRSSQRFYPCDLAVSDDVHPRT